jgi:hypothetical protein
VTDTQSTPQTGAGSERADLLEDLASLRLLYKMTARSLLQLRIERAKQGGLNVRPEVSIAIEDQTKELEDLKRKIAETEERLNRVDDPQGSSDDVTEALGPEALVAAIYDLEIPPGAVAAAYRRCKPRKFDEPHRLTTVVDYVRFLANAASGDDDIGPCPIAAFVELLHQQNPMLDTRHKFDAWLNLWAKKWGFAPDAVADSQSRAKSWPSFDMRYWLTVAVMHNPGREPRPYALQAWLWRKSYEHSRIYWFREPAPSGGTVLVPTFDVSEDVQDQADERSLDEIRLHVSALLKLVDRHLEVEGVEEGFTGLTLEFLLADDLLEEPVESWRSDFWDNEEFQEIGWHRPVVVRRPTHKGENREQWIKLWRALHVRPSTDACDAFEWLSPTRSVVGDALADRLSKEEPLPTCLYFDLGTTPRERAEMRALLEKAIDMAPIVVWTFPVDAAAAALHPEPFPGDSLPAAPADDPLASQVAAELRDDRNRKGLNALPEIVRNLRRRAVRDACRRMILLWDDPDRRPDLRPDLTAGRGRRPSLDKAVP